MKFRFYVLTLILWGSHCLHLEPLYAEVQKSSNYLSAIGDVMKKFKRRVTVLEIGRTQAEYSLTLAKIYKTACVAFLFDGGSQSLVQQIKADEYANVTVLAPRGIHHESLVTLGRCEHFDVVIIHDISSYIHANGAKILDAFTKLGDYVFIETSHHGMQNELKRKRIPLVAQNGNTALYLSYKPKTSLDIARFTQKEHPINRHPKYHIKSSHNEKYFIKKNAERPVKWVDGINLVTFAMLRGVYPDDFLIRKQLADMKKRHSDHNDLVLGNIIVQGERLVAIDFHDERRDADAQKCLAAALRAFTEGNQRQKNPEKWIREYYESV